MKVSYLLSYSFKACMLTGTWAAVIGKWNDLYGACFYEFGAVAACMASLSVPSLEPEPPTETDSSFKALAF